MSRRASAAGWQEGRSNLQNVTRENNPVRTANLIQKKEAGILGKILGRQRKVTLSPNQISPLAYRRPSPPLLD